jgi:hypothetical protein
VIFSRFAINCDDKVEGMFVIGLDDGFDNGVTDAVQS